MGTTSNPSANSIEINNLFHPTMISEIMHQDKVLEVAAATCSLHNDSPSTYQQAMISGDRHRWEEAMEEELKSLKDMGVWESASDVNLKQALGCRWVYTVKQDQQGAAGGSRLSTTALHWEIQTFDVTTVYLHSALKDTIYIRAPQGATGLPRVLKFQKALYGLKQAGRCWWNHLQNVLKKVGFESNPEDQSTYTYNRADGKAILWVHVDDGVIEALNVELLSKSKRLLKLELKLKWDDEVSSIVGITTKKADGSFELCQPALIKKLCTLNASNITASQPLPDMDLVSGKANAIDKEYLSWIVMLLYVAQATRPDKIYMQGTSTKSLVLRPDQGQDVLNVFVDANWGGEGSRSQHGYVGLLWGAPVMWNSKRQTCIASSTCQAEYMAISYSSKACLWIGQGLIGIAEHFTPTLLLDNKAAIQIAGDRGSRKNSRHIKGEFHLVNELLTKNQIKIGWISTEQQKADIMTKALGKNKLQRFYEGVLE
ncbi:hypothetical protein O181_040401 [Austropuccinia psidii MF-1]|uniref:Reverse transcriptase Ty1/copia-type domain-containing protein n=1 Tax=Austropuccinia psidii MF-1 TaxID=1389203 RepID=A0A9Q3DBA8_9BASI|nr:hypothetical protein [Austropuccinia psidii MF-1]